MHPWLRRLHHDLVKRALWTARDLREIGAAPGPADLVALRAGLWALVDEEGRPIDAAALWARLRCEAPEGVAGSPEAAALSEALALAQAAVADLPARPGGAPAALQAVLALEDAFAALARSMNLQK